MKPLIKLKTTTLLVIPLVLACFALLPRAQAQTPEGTISPAETISPLAGAELPGFNTELGFNALNNLTTGVFNSAFGALSLLQNSTGSHNTALGGQALRNNNGDFNTAVGENALVFNTTGDQNMGLGQGALANNITGNNNVAMGFQALNSNNSSEGVAVGTQALRSNTSGNRNVAIGFQSLFSNTTAGNSSNAVGFQSLFNSNGNFNNAFGWLALFNVTDGFNNTAMGDGVGINVTSGDNNTFIGANAGTGVSTASGVVCLGSIAGANQTNRTFVRNLTATQTQTFNAGTIRYVTVEIATGRLGVTTVVSSRRYKENIKPMDKVSEAILKLKPVTFRLKEEVDDAHMPGFGLIAEEVEEVNPDLVYHNEKGEPESVRYDAVNALLLNEFLKEHKKVEEQQASIAELKSTVALQQKGMEVLTAQLKEQAAQIQRVSAQVELNKPAPRTAVNK